MADDSMADTRVQDGAAASAAQDAVRADLVAAVRHLHFMAMQTKHDLLDVTSKLLALVEAMIASGQLDLRDFEARQARLREKESVRIRELAHVQVADRVDKYALENLPEIDCAARISLCKARCCTFTFPLSFQDLDEGIVQWNYAMPYQIRTKPDGYCAHYEDGSGRCGVYANRPATCRSYDCRDDKRIWIDFERRIPAPDVAIQEIVKLTRP
jgi:hypothetical protein